MEKEMYSISWHVEAAHTHSERACDYGKEYMLNNWENKKALEEIIKSNKYCINNIDMALSYFEQKYEKGQSNVKINSDILERLLGDVCRQIYMDTGVLQILLKAAKEIATLTLGYAEEYKEEL